MELAALKQRLPFLSGIQDEQAVSMLSDTSL